MADVRRTGKPLNSSDCTIRACITLSARMNISCLSHEHRYLSQHARKDVSAQISREEATSGAELATSSNFEF